MSWALTYSGGVQTKANGSTRVCGNILTATFGSTMPLGRREAPARMKEVLLTATLLPDSAGLLASLSETERQDYLMISIEVHEMAASAGEIEPMNQITITSLRARQSR